MAWTPFRNALPFGRPASGEGQPSVQRESGRPAATRPSPAAKPPSLDSIGQRDEVVRQRIGAMLDRLDDLRSLHDDFSSILEPLVQISDELPKASMRVAELEASLAQERQGVATARRDADDASGRIAQLGSALAEAQLRAEKAEAEAQERDQVGAELAIKLRDTTLAVEQLERQRFNETEQNKALLGENKALRLEAQAADSALARSEHELLAARERLCVLDQDSRRLQVLSEEQSAHLTELAGRHKDVEAAAEADRQRLRAIEAQIVSETASRERAETQFEVEVASYRSERGALTMKLEAMGNRAATAEQLLTQSRNLLREKDEAHRVAERSLKEASIARMTAERRVEGLQADVERQTERFLEAQRIRTELDARMAMLNKALAAKDAALEQAGLRSTALVDRNEDLIRKHEAARTEAETANRRLAEDLENERSERTLLQGALDIARETRVALQKQHDALKRSGRGWRDVKAEGDGAQESTPGGAETSNVRPFTSPGKSA